MATADAPELAECFRAERSRLVGLAYRVTGSVADAEDVVQEVWLRWQRAERGAIERPAAWLTTVTSRAALDRLRARRRRREDYVGPWLPEPVATSGDPEARTELAESLTFGFLVMLERLDPTERVVFLLADVFGEPYSVIASVVGRSEAACRQVASRARRRVRDERRALRRSPPDPDVAKELARAVLAGDLERTMALLDPDVVITTDGGPARYAARNPIVTAPRAARYLVNMSRRVTAEQAVRPAVLNGAPALVVGPPEQPDLAFLVDAAAGGRVKAIHIVLNRDKLRGVGAAGQP